MQKNSHNDILAGNKVCLTVNKYMPRDSPPTSCFSAEPNYSNVLFIIDNKAPPYPHYTLREMPSPCVVQVIWQQPGVWRSRRVDVIRDVSQVDTLKVWEWIWPQMLSERMFPVKSVQHVKGPRMNEFIQFWITLLNCKWEKKKKKNVNQQA